MIVYPVSGHLTDSEQIFFIGSANSHCLINGLELPLLCAGNFAVIFPLCLGDNLFRCQFDDDCVDIKVRRIEPDKNVPKHQWRESDWLPSKLIRRICLDPGHGGDALGTQSPKGIKEKDLNLQIALILEAELIRQGFEVKLTRSCDRALSLSDRVRIADLFQADLFLSIHHNAVADREDPLVHRGISVHYYYSHSLGLGEILLQDLVDMTGLSSAGLIKQNLHVLRENPSRLALLLELGYLIHPEESELIISSAFQNQSVTAITHAIKKYNTNLI
jgi:N-acetylmuramoyl-L-alanine amidase